MKVCKLVLPVLGLVLFTAPFSQAQTPARVEVQRSADQPIYKITVNVVERSTAAVNFRHRGGSTRLDFRGTPLVPTAHGEAEIEGRKGYIEIKTEMKDMPPASQFGPEFLTYVLWAITPEGRPVNLGEVLLDDNHRGVLNVTTDLQAFGLIVTAEPYFAVTQPNDAVVLENFVRPDTEGAIEQINAKYELLQRGQYGVNVPPGQLEPLVVDKKKPLDLYQARNAIRIARWAHADTDAADSFAKAESLLQQAETYDSRKAGNKPVSTAARGAVQAAEDARLIALKRQEEARIERERQAAANREQQAKAATDLAVKERMQAEEQQRLEAARRTAAEAEVARSRADADAAAARAAQQQQAAQAELERVQRDQQELRKQLTEQLNTILETRDTARGLIVNLSDVLFDVGKSTLKPGAREKLAKISGIVVSHRGLKLEVEGHTDSTGSEEFNQTLSEQRANAVREFLIQQGVDQASVTARGFGKIQPVASNDTAAGRQLNRRVEMVVSGDVIGNPNATGSTSSLP
jgi:outer membrane protein OmpA-like peptidoglycan-associated protein